MGGAGMMADWIMPPFCTSPVSCFACSSYWSWTSPWNHRHLELVWTYTCWRGMMQHNYTTMHNPNIATNKDCGHCLCEDQRSRLPWGDSWWMKGWRTVLLDFVKQNHFELYTIVPFLTGCLGGLRALAISKIPLADLLALDNAHFRDNCPTNDWEFLCQSRLLHDIPYLPWRTAEYHLQALLHQLRAPNNGSKL